jgi:hypothetical protein
MIYTLGVLALALSGTILALTALGWPRQDPKVEEFLVHPGAIQQFGARSNGSGVRPAEVSPLIVQAKLLASCLDPPKSSDRPSAPVLTASTSPAAPVVRPVAPSVRFKLCGTSYYPNEPGRSMALISDVGAAEGNERWVKEGAQLGHFVIHEIRKGIIVYRDGEQLREMAVAHGASVPSIVRDARSGSRKVSTAPDDVGIVAPAPARPNSIEIGGD